MSDLIEVVTIMVSALTGETTITTTMEPAPEPQPDAAPAVVSRFQARAALMDAGLLADVELALADAGPLAQLAWAEATEWRRDSPTIATIAEALDLTEGELNDLFRAASQITA